jgi:hypothetical protein
MPVRPTLLATAVALLAGAAVALPAAADTPGTVLATYQQPSRVAAWDGHVVFSAYDPATKRYSLMRSDDGAPPRVVPVAPQDRPFDVSLGTNAHGSVYAVYTRCTDGDTGCDIYRLRLSDEKESRLSSISSPRWDERDPAMYHGRVVFVRHERVGGRLQDTIRLASSGGSIRSKAIVKGGLLAHPALARGAVAFLSQSGPVSRTVQTLKVVSTRGGAARTVMSEPRGQESFVRLTGPTATQTARSFVWARTGTQTRAKDIGLFEYQIASHRTARGNVIDPDWASTAWAGGTLGLAAASDLYGGCYAGTAESPDDTNCTVSVTGPVRFRAR